MPSGYTHNIEKGISFKKFAMNCARAFGPCISMRDESSSASIPDKFKPSAYHIREIINIEDSIEKMNKLTSEQINERAKKVYEDNIKLSQEYLDKKKDLLRKYKKMLKEVEKWEPPTEDHTELKNFMKEQIEESIKFDCNIFYGRESLAKAKKNELSGKEWFDDVMEQLKKDLKYNKEKNLGEVERANGNTEWITELRNSLKKRKKRKKRK